MKKYKWIIFASFIMWVMVNLVYLVHFGGTFSNEIADYSGYGSFIGGTLGSVFTLITIIVLVFTMEHQRIGNERQIELLKSQIDVEKESNIENINLLNEQLNIQKKELIEQKNRWETEITRTIKRERVVEVQKKLENTVEKIEGLLNSKIDMLDLYSFVHENSEENITKYLMIDNNEKNYETIIERTYTEFAKANEDSNETKIINFLHTLEIAEFEYKSLEVPMNINYKVNNLVSLVNHVSFLTSDYISYGNASINMIKMLFYNVFYANQVLYNLGLYNTEYRKNVYDFLKKIQDYNSIVNLTFDTLNCVESKEKIYFELCHNKKLQDQLSLHEFIAHYSITKNGDELILKRNDSNSSSFAEINL